MSALGHLASCYEQFNGSHQNPETYFVCSRRCPVVRARVAAKKEALKKVRDAAPELADALYNLLVSPTAPNRAMAQDVLRKAGRLP